MINTIPIEVIEAAEADVKLLFNSSGNNLLPTEPTPPYRAVAWTPAMHYPESWEVCIWYDWPQARPNYSNFDIFLVQADSEDGTFEVDWYGDDRENIAFDTWNKLERDWIVSFAKVTLPCY